MGWSSEIVFRNRKLLCYRRAPRRRNVFRSDGQASRKWSEFPHCRGRERSRQRARQGAATRARTGLSDSENDHAERLQGAYFGFEAEHRRVHIESTDGHKIWGTVGVSDNIIDACWEALRDAVEYKLARGTR